MFDAAIRKIIDAPLARAASAARMAGLTANGATIGGFVIGMAALPLIATQHYAAALALILVSRFFDGLDGAIARQTRLTDFGGFLDITLDFIFYAGVVAAFALADPERNALAAAFLLFGFMGASATFLAFAIFAMKHGVTTDIRGRKSLYYLGGLSEGAETIGVFILSCLFPLAFPWVALVYGVMCLITAGTRIAAARDVFRDAPSKDEAA